MNPLEIALNIAMATVSDVGQKAIELHEQAVTAIQQHKNFVKEALERFEKHGVSKEDWELLNKLSETKTQSLEQAEQVGAKLTELVENVQKKITDAKEKGLGTSTEVASETLAKLTYALQQVKSRLSESQAEGDVLKQFQEFIKEDKEHLIKELAAIRPEFEIDTVSGRHFLCLGISYKQRSLILIYAILTSGLKQAYVTLGLGKLFFLLQLTDKADAVMLAYAQKRIRLLEDTLQEREQHEVKLLEEALKKQQNEHEKLSAMKLNHELEKLRTELNSLMMHKVNYTVYNIWVFSCLKFYLE